MQMQVLQLLIHDALYSAEDILDNIWHLRPDFARQPALKNAK
jgi:hypothetical protein